MKHLFLLSFLLVSVSVTAADSAEADDFHFLLSMLLKVNQDKYTYVDSEGKRQSDSLKIFKKMESVYMKYTQPDMLGGGYSAKRLKVLMLVAFYAENNNSGAFLEYLAGDLLPIYQKNRQAFLSGLNELPYMIPPVCGRLNAYFGHEGKNLNRKKAFLRDNRKYILANMAKQSAMTCLKAFKNSKSE